MSCYHYRHVPSGMEQALEDRTERLNILKRVMDRVRQGKAIESMV